MDFSKGDKYILHLCADQKFIDHVIDVFETVYPNKNIYFIELEDDKSEVKLIQSKHKHIIAGSSESAKFKKLTANISDFAAVVLHNIINPYKLDVILEAPKSVYFHWMSWGTDLYSIPALSRKIILPATRKYINNIDTIKIKCVKLLNNNFYYLFSAFYYLKNRRNSPLVDFKNCLKKIKSVSTVLPEEYEYVKKHISPSILYYPFKYATIERFDDSKEFVICKADNFLFGNSATVENNHLDTFLLAKAIDLKGRYIYCPLSYGDGNFKSYREHVISVGKSKFGKQFIPITDFLPLEEYSQILDLCGNVIMNHIRQQAMGNIIISLWKGARLFLNEKNPVYNFLISQGIKVFKISDLNNMYNLPGFNELAIINRPILKKLYSREQVLCETQNLVKILTNQHKS